MKYEIDFEAQQVLTMREVPAVVQKLTRLRPHLATVRRWAKVGVAGVKLPTAMVGVLTVTSREALLWWFRATATAREAQSAGARVAGPVTPADLATLQRAGIAS